MVNSASNERPDPDGGGEAAQIGDPNSTEPIPAADAVTALHPGQTEDDTEPEDELVQQDHDDGGSDVPGIGTGIDLLGGVNTAELLGVSSMLRQMQRSIMPDVTGWQRSLLPDMTEWQRSLFPSIEAIRQSILPALPATSAASALVGSGAFSAVMAVQNSGLAELAETVKAQQALWIKDMLPSFNAVDYLMPTLTNLSGILETQRSIVTSSAIQQLTARPVVDMSALLGLVPSQAMLKDILAAADLTQSINLSSLLTGAFGLPTVSSTAQASTIAQQAAARADDDAAEQAAIQAVLEAIEEELDPDAPPTPEQLGALTALARLIVALRPNLRENPTVGRWVVGIATGTTLQALVYLALAHPGILATFFLITGIAGSSKWVYDQSSGLLLPPKSEEPDD